MRCADIGADPRLPSARTGKQAIPRHVPLNTRSGGNVFRTQPPPPERVDLLVVIPCPLIQLYHRFCRPP